jgi:NTP pyrophosphatase (non-canonical NTP hydrolase)
MTSKTFYTEFVTDLFKSKLGNGCAEQYEERFGMLHAACGIAGEAGEVLDLIKKTVFTHKPLNHTHLVEELGDIEFYLEALRQEMGITRDEVLLNNWRKLSQRHNDNNIEDYYAN